MNLLPERLLLVADYSDPFPIIKYSKSTFYFSRCSFPSVFVVYTVIAFGVLEVCLLSAYTNRTSLFCTSRDLVQSIANETQFCTVQGENQVPYCIILLPSLALSFF